MLEKAKKIAASCRCGCNHTISTSIIECRNGATEMMISYVKENYEPVSALLVCDENTEKYADTIVHALGCRRFVLPGNAHATERETAILGDHIKSTDGKVSVMIACGSGSVHDITRFCAHDAEIDFISYPTAASVDGFVSGVAAMTMYGQKLTYPSSAPVALFAEPYVFCDAPRRLTASGVGDMIGKITALFDWKISNILIGETLCPDIYGVMSEALDRVIDASSDEEKVSSREFPVLIMEGLLLSGLAMQLAGNSRPASGSEHHLSHFWEMHVANEPTDALHGEKVGVGTALMLRHIHANRDILSKPFIYKESVVFDNNLITPVYKTLTSGIIKENLPHGKGSSALDDLGVCSLTDSRDTIDTLIDALPAHEFVEDLLRRCGGCVSLGDISLPDDEEFISTSLTFSPYVRNRLTFAKIISAAEISGET